MATDKYNFQYSVLTILQKSYQYMLAYMKYRSQKALLEQEQKFYERIYGRAFSNPDSVRLAYTQDDLTPQAMKELAAEHGIPVEVDPYGHNFVIYDAKYEAQLIRIVRDAEKRNARLFEENHYHETQYGFECYRTGEFIPYADPDTGSYIDKEGRLHRGPGSGDLEDDVLIDRLDARRYDPDAVWDRQTDGSLLDEFGYVYRPTEGIHLEPRLDRMEGCPVHKGSVYRKGRIDQEDLYIRCPGGYRRSDGDFLPNYNEYGDYYSPEDKAVHLNRENRDNEEARIQRLYARETAPVNTGYRYVRASDGNLINVESRVVVPLRDEEGIVYSIRYPDGMDIDDREKGIERGDDDTFENGQEPEVPEDITPEEAEEPSVWEEASLLYDIPDEDIEKERSAGEYREDSHEEEAWDEPSAPAPDVTAENADQEAGYEMADDEPVRSIDEKGYSEAEDGISIDEYIPPTAEDTYAQPVQDTYPDGVYSDSNKDASVSDTGYKGYHDDAYQESPVWEDTSDEPVPPNQEPSGADTSASYSEESGRVDQGTSPSENYSEPGNQYHEDAGSYYEQKHAQDNASTVEKVVNAQREASWENIPHTGGGIPSASPIMAGAAGTIGAAGAAEAIGSAGIAGATGAAGALSDAASKEAYVPEPSPSSSGSGSYSAKFQYDESVEKYTFNGASSDSNRNMQESGNGGRAEQGNNFSGAMSGRRTDGYAPFEPSEKIHFSGNRGAQEPEVIRQKGVGSGYSSRKYSAPDEDRIVSGSFGRKNREALHNFQEHGLKNGSPAYGRGISLSPTESLKQKGAGDDLARKKEKFGFEAMTAQKKYGFQSISPSSRIAKPSTDGLMGAFAGAYRQIGIGAEKETKVHVSRYVRNVGAVYNVAGGFIVYRNAVQTASEYFTTLQKSGSLGYLNKILTANGRRPVADLTSKGIREASDDIIRIASKARLVDRRGKMLFVNKMDRGMYVKLGIRNGREAAIFENSLKNAVSLKNGSSMISRGVHVLSYSLRMAIMNSDDRTLGYVSQGIDTINVFRQFGKSLGEVKDSAALSRPLRGNEAKRALSNSMRKTNVANGVPDKIKGASFRFRKDASTPLHGSLRPGRDSLTRNARAIRKYQELRRQQVGARFGRLHRGAEIRAQKLISLRKARLNRVDSAKRIGGRFSRAINRPVNSLKMKIGDTRIGRQLASLRSAALKKQAARKAANAAAKRAAQKTLGAAIEGASKAVSAVMSKLAVILGVYLLVCLAVCVIVTILLVPLLHQMSAETDDASLASGVAMEDVYDKSHTMTGIIYNELRYMELQWASEIRSYGTETTPLALNELNFTEYNVSARQYVLSQTGADDLLGVWAYDSTKTKGTGDSEERYEGLLGPEPFEGAALQDYKLLRDIDGGSTLELRGKPQEGYTSNAKQVTAMASVFYSQSVDTLLESSNSKKGLAGFVDAVKNFWKAAWTWFETKDVPVLGYIGKMTGWSWTSIYRNYAYPLMQASHQENFYLSSYIYPTLYTYNSGSSRWDGAKGGNPDENGDQTVKVDQVTGQKAKNGRIGVTTEGGSGKVSSDFKVSNDIYQGQGDADWLAIEMCPDDIYNGYGCQYRKAFGYRYNGHFATDDELNNTYPDELSTLYYGSNPDEETEFGSANDVSADVSPWASASDAEKGYDRDSCIIHILQLTDEASNCWILESKDELTSYNWKDDTELIEKTFHSGKMNREYLNRGLDFEEDLTIQKIVETEDGCDVYVSYPFNTYPVTDPTTGWVIDGQYATDYIQDGFILHFKHECQQNHDGYYCGGHLQLRTRGIVYGFSEEQTEEGTVAEQGTISAFAPKFLDPINYQTLDRVFEAEDRLPDDSDADEKERDAYPDVHVWNVDEHSIPEGDEHGDAPHIEPDALQKLYLAEDIFDIDSMILRERESYPGYSTKSEASVTGTQTSALSKWTGWTYTNMSNAIDMTYLDWFETYALADTQTAVGGIYDNTADGLNNLSDAVIQKIIEILAGDLPINVDILDSEAKKADGSILTAEERERIDRVRHVVYALNCVGEVSYSQSAHANQYGDLKGNATDCSGFVSNIWRDRIEAPLTVNGLYNNSYISPLEYNGINTAGIEPGDIILVNPEEADGEAHALIYIGTFNTDDLYGDGSGTGEERVFTVDCSSMVFNVNDLASQDDTPVESKLTDGDGVQYSLSDVYADSSQSVEDTPKVRSGNVRFADREYVNTNTDNMYYIDMYSWDACGQRQLYDDYSDLGDSGVQFWESASVITDMTQTRQEMDIQFPVDDDDVKDAVVDVDIPEDEQKIPTQDPNEPIVDGTSVVLDMNQYIQQSDRSFGSLKRGGIGSNATISNSGCCDCSYLMACHILPGQTFDVGATLSQSKYYSGNLFAGSVLLSEYGLHESRTSGYNPNSIRDAIDQGYPVVMQIKGRFSFHSSTRTHFVVIMDIMTMGL